MTVLSWGWSAGAGDHANSLRCDPHRFDRDLEPLQLGGSLAVAAKTL